MYGRYKRKRSQTPTRYYKRYFARKSCGLVTSPFIGVRLPRGMDGLQEHPQRKGYFGVPGTGVYFLIPTKPGQSEEAPATTPSRESKDHQASGQTGSASPSSGTSISQWLLLQASDPKSLSSATPSTTQEDLLLQQDLSDTPLSQPSTAATSSKRRRSNAPSTRVNSGARPHSKTSS